MAQQAMFAGLVYDEQEIVLETSYVGSEAFYVVDDSGFLRHIDAEVVDRQVLGMFIQQLQENKEFADY